MNERIRELIEKATIRGEEYLPGNDGHPTPTFYFDKEKFAELIVKECMDQVWYTREDGINGNVSEVIKDRIKQHFGVEE